MKTIYKIEMVLILALIITFGVVSVRPRMTGYVEAVNITVYSQDLNIMVSENENYIFTSEDAESFGLTSIKLTGQVIGDGRVEVYVNDGENQLLIYSNAVRQVEPTSYITGMATQQALLVIEPSKEPIGELQFRPLMEDEIIVNGSFSTACIETCRIPEGFFNAPQYQLFFKVEEGTRVIVDEIIFTKD